MSLYSGLSSAMRQQFIYSTTRFGLHQKAKEYLQVKDLPFVLDLSMAAACGLVGAILKNPMEIVNTRMQADLKLRPHQRYNYKNMIQALKMIAMVDGYRALYSGVLLTSIRSIAFTTSQICLYDQFKLYLIEKHKFTDTIGTHVLASAMAGIIAASLCQPVDVVKVRFMTDDSVKSIQQTIMKQLQLGYSGFYRGTLLTFVKIELQTILTFVGLERMRLHYGLTPRYCTKEERAHRIIDVGQCIRRLRQRDVIAEEMERKKWKKLTKIRNFVYNAPNELLILLRLKKRKIEEKKHRKNEIILEKIHQIRKLGGHSKLQHFLQRLIRTIMTKRERERAEKEQAEKAKLLEEEEEEEDTIADEEHIVKKARLMEEVNKNIGDARAPEAKHKNVNSHKKNY